MYSCSIFASVGEYRRHNGQPVPVRNITVAFAVPGIDQFDCFTRYVLKFHVVDPLTDAVIASLENPRGTANCVIRPRGYQQDRHQGETSDPLLKRVQHRTDMSCTHSGGTLLSIRNG